MIRLSAAPGRPRILLLAIDLWEHPARLAGELGQAGLQVYALAPPRHIIHRTQTAERCFVHSGHGVTSLRRTLKSWLPDIIIPADDQAVELLHAAHVSLTRGEPQASDAAIVGLIERSIGTPAYFSTVAAKSAVYPIAQQCGVRIPRTECLVRSGDIEACLDRFGYPLVLKADHSCGGNGVRVVAAAGMAERAYDDVVLAGPGTKRLRQLLSVMPSQRLRHHLRVTGPTVSIQEFVHGQPATLSAFCSNGVVLAHHCAVVEHTVAPNAPSSVLRFIENDTMSWVARTLVAKLGLSGFCGFDFMIDRDDTVWFLEINPRATPGAHIKKHADLCGTVFDHLSGAAIRPTLALGDCDLVALFPKEWQRDRDSPLLATAAHDVPWHMPHYITAVLTPPPKSWLTGLRSGSKKRSFPV
jgi:glutathione synthase/RimK-type ligase-like ATP-grasp enzyme